MTKSNVVFFEAYRSKKDVLIKEVNNFNQPNRNQIINSINEILQEKRDDIKLIELAFKDESTESLKFLLEQLNVEKRNGQNLSALFFYVAKSYFEAKRYFLSNE